MLHLDQKAAKCTTPTCKRFCGKFSLFIATKSFKTRFWKKFPVAKRLIKVVLAVFLSGKEKKRKRFHERSPSTNVARVQIPASTPYVSWVCRWFSPLLREVFLRVLRFSPLLKNQHFQIPIRPGIWFQIIIITIQNNFNFYYYKFRFMLPRGKHYTKGDKTRRSLSVNSC